jgi:Kdo2-lipid IVA lauroyltransferase/acyltransferase
VATTGNQSGAPQRQRGGPGANGAGRPIGSAADEGGAGANLAAGLPLRQFDRKPARPVLNLKSRVQYWLMLAVLYAFSLLPDFVLYPIGVAGGWLGYQLDRRHVRIGLKNLEIAFPTRSESERRRILRASYVNLGRSGAEYVRLAGFFHRRLRRRISYERLDLWQQIHARHPGRGLIILTAHFGNFELLPAGHAMHGYQIGLVHHTQRFAAGDALTNHVRTRAGVEVIRKHSAARAVLRALRAGELIGLPFDQNAKRSEALFVPFFGEPAATASGVARVAMISGAAVVPVFLVRQPDMRSHHIVIHDEIPMQRSGDLEADVLENTRRMVAAVEEIVRRYPDQFLWTHRRFRTRPRGMAPVYDWEMRGSRRSSDRGVGRRSAGV